MSFSYRREDGFREKGFTLLEVIAAIAILTFGILAIGAMQVSAIRGNQLASEVSEATTWAGDRLELLMTLPYSDSSLQDTDADGNAGLADAAAATADHQRVEGKYSIYWNIADDMVLSETKTIRIIVVWSNHGVQKNVSISSLKAEI